MAVKIKKDIPSFKVGDKFVHTEFGTQYEVSKKVDNTYTISYKNQHRPDTTMGAEHIQQMITFQRWKKVT